MFRLYDWECNKCETVIDAMIDVPHGEAPRDNAQFYCLICKRVRPMTRCQVNLIAEYHGERVLNPIVHGGEFDTAGAAKVPMVPMLRDGATMEELRDHVRKPEYIEAKRVRSEVIAQNKAKKKRLALIKKGEYINMRRDRLPGDPKLTS
jgi:hypothetical protein